MTPSIRVLLVEDNEVYRSSLELLLGMQAGLAVVGAVGSGAEAVERVAIEPPDVVLLDFRLPGMDGTDTTAAIRAVSPQIAVICLTAEAGDEDRTAVLDAGAFALVEKGEPVDALVQLVRSAANVAQ